jgi:hypothetical protein
VPHVVETFSLTEQESRTHLEYEGEMGDDLWALGEWWMSLVARRWEQVVGDSFDTIKAEVWRRSCQVDLLTTGSGFASSPAGITREGNRCWSPTSASIQIIARAVVDVSTDIHAHA